MGVDIEGDGRMKVISKKEELTEKWARLKIRHFLSVIRRVRPRQSTPGPEGALLERPNMQCKS